jgi:hypothetical protein
MIRLVQHTKSFLAPLAALVELVRTAPGCGGDCSGGRRPCTCRQPASTCAAPVIAAGEPRCVSCGQLQGERHLMSCPFDRFTIQRAQ